MELQNVRWIVAFLAFVGFIFNYMLRVNVRIIDQIIKVYMYIQFQKHFQFKNFRNPDFFEEQLIFGILVTHIFNTRFFYLAVSPCESSLCVFLFLIF